MGRGASPVPIDVAGPRPAGMALDLGCGEGSDTLWLAARGWRVTAVDGSASALAVIARRQSEVGWTNSGAGANRTVTP